MKGLEEELELEELENNFRKKVVIYTSMIIFSSASLIKEVIDYIYKRKEILD